MPRALRICLTLLGPAPLALATVVLGEYVQQLFEAPVAKSSLSNWEIPTARVSAWDSLISVLLTLIPAYLIAGLPSLVYTAAMEWAISEGTDPRSWKFVGLSTFLGTLCGLAIGIFIFFSIQWLIPLGAWVGFVIGLIIKFMPERLRFRRRSKGSRKRRREIVHD